MRKKHNEGFTLVELLVSMAILAAIVIPTCTSLVLSYRMNAKTDKMMQAQLAVSSTVETLMAKGITDEFLASLENIGVKEGTTDVYIYTSNQFPGMKFVLTEKGEYYDITVMDEAKLVEVITSIRYKTSSQGGGQT